MLINYNYLTLTVVVLELWPDMVIGDNRVAVNDLPDPWWEVKKG